MLQERSELWPQRCAADIPHWFRHMLHPLFKGQHHRLLQRRHASKCRLHPRKSCDTPGSGALVVTMYCEDNRPGGTCRWHDEQSGRALSDHCGIQNLLIDSESIRTYHPQPVTQKDGSSSMTPGLWVQLQSQLSRKLDMRRDKVWAKIVGFVGR